MTFTNTRSTCIGILFITLFVAVAISSCSNDDDPPLKSKTYEYQMHNGQTVPSLPYAGIHSDLSATLLLEELNNGNTNITVTLSNTVQGEFYNIHAHDAADPMTTPNGTPYLEAPNSNILVQRVEGNNGTIQITQEANLPFDNLTSSYEGFFVIHDPLQPVSTMDISTFMVVGSFARDQTVTNLRTSEFQYAFNTGQIAAQFAYQGDHTNNLNAIIRIDELADNRSRVTVLLQNTIDEMIYHTHAHNAADPNTTPNGTPYLETPNSDVFVSPIEAKGASGGAARISPSSYVEILNSYDGFFVVHDPLQAVSTVDPTTFVLLGLFAR